MNGGKDAQVPEGALVAASPPAARNERAPSPTDWLLRHASALVGTAVSVTAWEVATTVRVTRLATDLALRGPGELLDRAGQAVGWLGEARPNLPEEANRALVLRLYRAAVQADLGTVRKLFDQNVTWHAPGPEPVAGRYRGIAEMVQALAAIWRQIGTVDAVELQDIIASPQRAAALLRLSVVRSGRRSTVDWWLMFRIDSGQVTEAWGPFPTEPRL